MNAKFLSDEIDIEKSDGRTTVSLEDDDDECDIEIIDIDDNYEDDVGHCVPAIKMFCGYEENENDNYNIHDQLPSVEEVKASNAYLPTMRLLTKIHRRKLYLTISAAALAAIVLSVLISIGLFETANSRKAPAKESVYVADSMGNRFEKTVNFVVEHHVSNLPNLMEPQTSEYRAAQFVAGGDAYNAKFGDFFSPEGRRFLERYILALFYYQANGVNWNDQHKFLTPIDHCDWNNKFTTLQGTFVKGVQCNQDGFVVDIDLSNNNLFASEIPYELNYMSFLEKLHLFGNPLGGTFPNVLKLKNLKSIGLMNTEISGTIPHSIGDMTQLTTLSLGHTKISKFIPNSIEQLEHLRILGLDGLGLVGKIEKLLNLQNLEVLYLEDNNLSGEITNNNWKKMKELDMSNNIISGSIPEALLKNTNLQVLDLHGNDMFGYFPTEIVTNDGLQYFNIHKNRFMGTVSDRIGYLSNLKHLDISGNLLTGTLPDTFAILTNLVSLNTSGNHFERQRRDFLYPLTKLQDLSMKGNSITGTLPEYFANMLSLQLLDLDGNELKGTISTYMGILHNLKALMLNRNFLSGTIPSELSKLSKLEILLLDGNYLKGKTSEICRSTSMKLHHFITDCYPSILTEEGSEVDCRCCTMCCNDESPQCNNKDWSSNYDPKSKYGYIRPAYEFSLDQAPEGWQKKTQQEAGSMNSP